MSDTTDTTTAGDTGNGASDATTPPATAAPSIDPAAPARCYAWQTLPSSSTPSS